MNVQNIVCFERGKSLLNLNSFNYRKNSDFVEYLRNITDQRVWFNASLGYWNNEPNPSFAETLTRFGLGLTFNIVEYENLMHFNRTSKDFKYEYIVESVRPKRPWRTGEKLNNGLSMRFNYFDFSVWSKGTCRNPSFFVHSPFELPITSSPVIFEYGRSLTVSITPEIIQTDNDLRSTSPEKRKCYFEDERNLTYFKTYTQKNCEMECFSFTGKLTRRFEVFFKIYSTDKFTRSLIERNLTDTVNFLSLMK